MKDNLVATCITLIWKEEIFKINFLTNEEFTNQYNYLNSGHKTQL